MISSSDSITLAEANRIVDAALEKARSENMAPMAVAVVDTAGIVRALQSEDGCALLRTDIAYAKAWGCVGIGFSSRAFKGAFQAMPDMVPALYTFSGLANNRVVPSPGGVFILRGEAIIGAVGVSGDLPDRDEECALAGIAAASLQHQL